MKLNFYGKSDKGKLRKNNEDYFSSERLSHEESLFIVADGMGGHQAGDVASKLGVLTFIEHYKIQRSEKNTIPAALKTAINLANDTILEKAAQDLRKRGMGTTFSALSINGGKGHIVHVGDSRIYLVRNNIIVRLTTDHTFVEKMVEEGRLTEAEARDHPQKNILYMSLGARQSFFPEISDSFDVREGDIFILCSDGLNNMVSDAILKEVAIAHPPKKAAEVLVRLANRNGGADNITLLIIQVEEKAVKDKTEPIKPIQPKISRKKSFIASIFAKKNHTEEI